MIIFLSFIFISGEVGVINFINTDFNVITTPLATQCACNWNCETCFYPNAGKFIFWNPDSSLSYGN